jgi:hypothetical protein
MYPLLHPDLARTTMPGRKRRVRSVEPRHDDQRRHLVERDRVRASLLVRPEPRPGEQR